MAGVFLSPSGTVRNWYNPHGVLKAVFSSSPSRMGIRAGCRTPTSVENRELPSMAAIPSVGLGNGNASGMVASLSFL